VSHERGNSNRCTRLAPNEAEVAALVAGIVARENEADRDHALVRSLSRHDMELFLARPRPRGGVPSSSTKRREVGVLRSFYNWLWEEGYTSEHLARGLHGPKAKGRDPKPIPDPDWKKLWLADWPSEIRVILGLAYFGGLRRAELWDLRVGQLDTEQLANFTRKGGGSHGLPLGTILKIYEGSELLAPLLVHRCLLTDSIRRLQDSSNSDDWLVPFRSSAKSPDALNKRFTRWCALVDVDHLTPHQCRHSAATNLARAGVPPHLVMSIMNHSSLDVTMRYVRTTGAELEEWVRSS
jgi:integrase/recombinase XerC